MGLFDRQYDVMMDMIGRWQKQGALNEIRADQAWPPGNGFVLKGQTALELGRPDVGSCAVLLWAESDDIRESHVFVAGADSICPATTEIPLAMIFAVRGEFEGHEYERYCELTDAVYGPELDGFMIRSMPSSGNIWCRISKDAVGRNLTYGMLGRAFIDRTCDLEFVHSADVVIVPDAANMIKRINPIADQVRQVGSALMKMSEELLMECDTCDFSELCENVDELKKIRARLAREEKGAWPEK